jgi:glycerophosphoryl diester phosphodiesterase
MARAFPFFEHPGPLAFAHRGGAAEAPENSWSAFENAVALGFRYVETDARATADGVAIVIHDPDFQRVTGHAGPVRSMTWRQVQALRLPDEREPPRLEDLLGAWPDLRWNIDVKRREAVAPVVDAIRRTGSIDRVLVAAFSGRRTAMVRTALRTGPGVEVATAAGRLTVAMLLGAKAVPGLRFQPKAAAAQVPVRHNGITIVNAAFVHTCRRFGVALHVWTVDDPAEMGRLLDLGVDGLMTDRPSVLREVLRQRGQWS